MAFSAGVYTLPTSALVSGQTVSASENNTVRNDMAASFNLTWLRNGTAAATANIPMGSFKLTGLGAATTSGDALSYGNAAVVTTLTSTSLTATRVPYAGTGGLLQDASTFTFDGTTLTAGGFSTSGNIAAATATVSGNITVSGGTANGVAYLNGSKVLTTGSALTFDGTNFATTGTASATKLIPTGGAATGNGMYLPASNTLAWSNNGSETMRLDSSGNLGLGVTPSAWGFGKAIQVGNYGNLWDSVSGDLYLINNAYFNGANWVYKNTNYASHYQQVNGTHTWSIASSGTAGNAISFTRAMVLDVTGNLLVGNTSQSVIGERLLVNGAGVVIQSASATNRGMLGNFGGSDFIVGSYDSIALAFRTGNTERMRIDSSGNVGIGTSTATGGRLVVQGVSGNNALKVFDRSGNSALRVDEYGTVFVEQSDLVVKSVIGTPSDGTAMVFKEGASEKMRIDSSGNLLVGRTSSNYTDLGAAIFNSGTVSAVTPEGNDTLIAYQKTTSTGYVLFSGYSDIGGTRTNKILIYTNGNIQNVNNSYGALSDATIKENIVDATPKLESLCKVKVRNFNLIGDTQKQIGVVAQELEQVFPSLVDENKDGIKGVKYSVFVPMLVKAIQELKAELDATKAEVAALKGV